MRFVGNCSPAQLAYLAATLAGLLVEELSSEEAATVAAFLVMVGDTVTLLLAAGEKESIE